MKFYPRNQSSFDLGRRSINSSTSSSRRRHRSGDLRENPSPIPFVSQPKPAVMHLFGPASSALADNRDQRRESLTCASKRSTSEPRLLNAISGPEDPMNLPAKVDQNLFTQPVAVAFRPARVIARAITLDSRIAPRLVWVLNGKVDEEPATPTCGQRRSPSPSEPPRRSVQSRLLQVRFRRLRIRVSPSERTADIFSARAAQALPGQATILFFRIQRAEHFRPLLRTCEEYVQSAMPVAAVQRSEPLVLIASRIRTICRP